MVQVRYQQMTDERLLKAMFLLELTNEVLVVVDKLVSIMSQISHVKLTPLRFTTTYDFKLSTKESQLVA